MAPRACVCERSGQQCAHTHPGRLLLDSLKCVATRVGVSIVTEERQHKANLDVAAQSRTPISVERVAYDSLLKRWEQEFLRATGRPFELAYLRRSTLAATGLPIRRNIFGKHRLRRRKRARGQASAKMSFVNAKVRKGHVKRKWSEHSAARVAAAHEWDAMSQQQRDDFLERWRLQRDLGSVPSPPRAPPGGSSTRTATCPTLGSMGSLGSGSTDLWQTWDEHWPVPVIGCEERDRPMIWWQFRLCIFGVPVPFSLK